MELFNATQKRLLEIQAKNKYQIKTIWECHFKQQLRDSACTEDEEIVYIDIVGVFLYFANYKYFCL